MPDQPIPVTDHALVRYFERIEGRDFSEILDKAIVQYLIRSEGVDIEAIKDRINNPDLLEWYRTCGDGGKYPVENAFYARIVDGVVVTILPIK